MIGEWNLNEAENKGFVSSGSVAVASEEGEPGAGATRIFGFSNSSRRQESAAAEPEPYVVTLQFFPEGGGPSPDPTAAAGRLLVEPLVTKKSRRGPRSRSSQFGGVTFYRKTDRWESHIWWIRHCTCCCKILQPNCDQVPGTRCRYNFDLDDYQCDLGQMSILTKEEFIHVLQRERTSYPRGSSKYRGVTLHKCGKWEARMGQFVGKKYVYLGLFDTEIEAARHNKILDFSELMSRLQLNATERMQLQTSIQVSTRSSMHQQAMASSKTISI